MLSVMDEHDLKVKFAGMVSVLFCTTCQAQKQNAVAGKEKKHLKNYSEMIASSKINCVNKYFISILQVFQ